MDEGYSFSISIDDFDKGVLPPHARSPGSDEFQQEVSQFFGKEFAAFKGRARIIVDAKNIQVSWQSDPNNPDPMKVIDDKLERGQLAEAIQLLEILRRYQPNDLTILKNLGMALSDLGQFDEAEAHLRHALKVDPGHINAQVALAVALIRQGRIPDAVPILQKAIAQEPSNPWAHRNLGGCLMQMGQLTEAEEHFRKAVELNPSDQQGWFGLAQTLQMRGEPKEADACYLKVVELDSRTPIAEKARQERTHLAEESFRRKGAVRPDAVMFCLSAIQKFEKMNRQEIQKIGFEIGIMGQRGLDTNNATPQYQLKSMAGQFSGLQLVCTMYVAFKLTAPEQDIGFDLSNEYRMAQAMHEGKV